VTGKNAPVLRCKEIRSGQCEGHADSQTLIVFIDNDMNDIVKTIEETKYSVFYFVFHAMIIIYISV
jgi:hypothetical protein